MVSLLDIKTRDDKTVKVRGVSLPVPGVSVEGAAVLMARFPIVKDLFKGKVSAEDFTVERLTAMAPELVHALIAAGTADRVIDDAHVTAASKLSLGEQTEVLM